MEKRSVEHEIQEVRQQLRNLENLIRNSASPIDAGILDALESLYTLWENLAKGIESVYAENAVVSGREALSNLDNVRNEHIFNADPDAILISDAQGIIEKANPAAVELLGLHPGFLAGKSLLVCVAAEDRISFSEELDRLYFIEGTHTFESRMRVPSGASVSIRVYATVVRAIDGLIHIIIWKLRDLQEIKKLQDEYDRLRNFIRPMEWLLSRDTALESYQSYWEKMHRQYHGQVAQSGTSHLLADSVGIDYLLDIAIDTLYVLDTSISIFEKNGDSVVSLAGSQWCRFLVQSSRGLERPAEPFFDSVDRLCPCHQLHWRDVVQRAIDTSKDTDTPCPGSLRLFAVPIMANGESVGAISMGYGDPPKDEETLRDISIKYHANIDDLRRHAESYKPRPPFLVEIAKGRLRLQARLIGQMIERRRAEQAIRQLADLSEENPDPVARVSPDGVVLYVNKAAQPFLQSWNFQIGAQVAGNCLEMVHNAFVSQHPIEEEIEAVGRTYLFAIVPIIDRSYANIYGMDITERKRTEKEREELLKKVDAQRNLLQVMVENAPVAISILSGRDFTVKLANPASLSMIKKQFQKQEVIGKRPADLLPDSAASGFLKILMSVASTGDPYINNEYEYHDLERGATYWRMAAFPVTEMDEPPDIIVLAADITYEVRARKKAEKQAEERMVYLERMNALIRASEGILNETNICGLLDQIVKAACELTGASSGIVSHGCRDGVECPRAVFGKESVLHQIKGPGNCAVAGGLYDAVVLRRKVLHLAEEDLRKDPEQWQIPQDADFQGGILGAPLIGRKGDSTGVILLSGKKDGFTAEDKAMLAQLTTSASLGLRHIEVTEEAQRRANELHTLLDTMMDPVVTFDATGNLTECNTAALRILDIDPTRTSRDVLMQKLMIRDTDGHPLSAVDLPISRALREKKPTKGILRLRSITGEELIFDAISSPIGTESEVVGGVTVLRDITEMQNLMEQLEQERNRLHILFENSPVAIITMDPDGVITMWNPAAEQTYGWTAEEVIGRFNPTVPEDSLGAFAALREKILSGQTVTELQLRKHRKDGTPVDINLYGAPITDKQGHPAILAMLADITGMKHIELALRASEERVRYFLKHNPNAIAVLDKDMCYLMVSDRFLQDYRIQSSNVIGKCHYDVFPEIPDRWKEIHQRALAGEVVGSESDVFPRQDGSVDYNRWECRPWFDAEGKIGGIIMYTEVITERVLAEQALRASEEKYRELVQNANSIILRFDGDGKITFFNEYAQQFFGYSEEEVLGRDVSMLAPSVSSTGLDLHGMFREIIDSPESYRANENESILKNGQHVWIAWNNRALRDNEGNVKEILAVGTDITERRQAEEKLHQTLEELARSNRDLEQFAYVASHDLQEPLRAITSYLQLLKRRYAESLPPEADEFIGFAVSGASRMKDLIADLLTYSRVDTRGKPLVSVSSEDSLHSALDALKEAIRTTGATITHDPLPMVMGDEMQIPQVFQNLISNGIKFHGPSPPQVNVSAEKLDGEWIFSVRDNGIGIDPKYFDRIFTIFERLHGQAEYAGTGIGLAICKRIIERHGGNIWVESKPGQGSTFYFTLPAVEEEGREG